MAPGRKQGGSCWTCRLRRKRCNLGQPTCEGCEFLGITCYTGQARPSWMDGGDRQRQMSETIKRQIKQNAVLRRERRALTHEDQNMIFTAEMDHIPEIDTMSTMNSRSSPPDSMASTLSTSSVEPTPHDSSAAWSNASPAAFTTPSSTSDLVTQLIPPASESSWPAGPATPIQMHLGSLMMYLDHVFPFLFPFYQPSLIETGRQWLLGLLCQNDVFFHIAASLSAYFFTLIPQKGGQDMHADCVMQVRDGLSQQMDMAFKSIQNTISIFGQDSAQRPLLDKVRVMEEITQLLIVEVTVRKEVDWAIHLTPALALLDEIIKTNGIDHSGPSLLPLLTALPASIPAGTPHNKPHPNTADQSALVFFVSLLFFVDIIASTSVSAPPTLQSYHHSLLSAAGEDESCVRLENVIGCQSWALVAIGQVAALCAWKRDAKSRGNFSVFELVNLAQPISRDLEEGLNSLNTNTTYSEQQNSGAGLLRGYYSRHDGAIDDNTIAEITRIWAYAAKVYLEVTLSGWQAQSREIQANIAEILRRLQAIKSPAQLRSLAWPICVAASLAQPSQRDEFRHIIGKMGRLSEFGTIRDAIGIMEAVWMLGVAIDRDTWDISSSLNVLGSPVLLI